MPELPAMRPESVPMMGSVEKLLVPEKVLLLERSVDDAALMVMLPEPSNETVLMVTALASLVAVAALPVTLIDIAEEVAIDAKVFAPVAYRRPEAAEMLEEVAMPPNVIAPPPPRTVCAEQICGQVHVSDEVATPYTPAAPLETRRLDDEG